MSQVEVPTVTVTRMDGSWASTQKVRPNDDGRNAWALAGTTEDQLQYKIHELDDLGVRQRPDLHEVGLGVERLRLFGEQHPHHRHLGAGEHDAESLVVMLQLGAQVGAVDGRVQAGAHGIDRRAPRAGDDPLAGRGPHAAFAVTSLRNVSPSSYRCW